LRRSASEGASGGFAMAALIGGASPEIKENVDCNLLA
jgi:hypothetical protein